MKTLNEIKVNELWKIGKNLKWGLTREMGAAKY